MQDKPDTDVFMRSLARFMRETAMTKLSGHAAFEARVAFNVLEIMRREQTWGARFAAAQRARLAALLGEDGTLLALNQALCRRIRAGEISLRDPNLRIHLRKAAMGKLAIDQPSYASYRRAQKQGWSEEDGYEAAGAPDGSATPGKTGA